MKYDSDLIIATALPNAPMIMPKQRLERGGSLMATLRNVLAVLPWL
ncbi:hypothetical protein [uncultured Devosia sp.]